jgi:hypothetical protein
MASSSSWSALRKPDSNGTDGPLSVARRTDSWSGEAARRHGGIGDRGWSSIWKMSAVRRGARAGDFHELARLAARCFREPYFVEKGKEASLRVWRDTMAVRREEASPSGGRSRCNRIRQLTMK